jgi:alkylation response protein AidB-like acyl-CoA dehydrogenase
MDFDLSQSQRLLQESARDLLRRECPLTKVRELMASETGVDAKLWGALVEQGWTGMTLPESVGGLELEFVDLALVAEEMGRASLPTPFFSTFWAASLLQHAGAEEQRKRFLEPIAAGEKTAAVAWLEPGGSWDPSSIRMTAKKEGGQFRLTGKKVFVIDGAGADWIICVARHGDDLALIPVERGSKGLSVRATPTMDETRKATELTFESVAADQALVLSRDAVVRANDLAAVFLCAELVGAMQWMMDTSVEYAKTRQQFNQPIGSFQGVQHQCADMLMLTESARSAAYYAAWALTVDDPSAPLAAATAKAYCSDAAREVGNKACQVHGGIGFTWEHDLHLYYKRTKSSETLLGDPTFHRERTAQLVLD